MTTKEVQRIYNLIVEGLDNESDIILRLNDILAVFLLLTHKAFERTKNKVLLINSIKEIVNKFVNDLMKRVTKEEVNTKES